jgi:predicted ribosomally synthesized peptide with SipW-like signal peptide
MSSHLRREPRPGLARRLRSPRLRALLGLGVLLGVGATGTFAYWTDEVTIAGTSFTAGNIDLKVNNANSYATTTLSMSAMVPGNTSAEVLIVNNSGTAPLKYALAGGLTGTDAAAYNTAAALKLTIVSGGTRLGTANTSTCTGGTVIVNAVALTSTTTTAIFGSRPTIPLAAAGTESLCFQVGLDAAAPSSLQNKTATATFTFTGTSDVS